MALGPAPKSAFRPGRGGILRVMRRDVADLESWSLGRSCDAPECGRLVEGRGSFGLRSWLLGHRFCSDACRLRVEMRPAAVGLERPA